MKSSSLFVCALALSVSLSACASSQPGAGEATSSPSDASSAGATAGATSEAAATSAPSGAAAATAAQAPSATASASAAPAVSAKPGVKKDDNALVVELLFTMKGGGSVDDATRAELVKAAEARIAKSPSIASKGTTVDKPRAVIMTVSLDKPVTDAKGLTVHMGITGVEQNGKCPLFDLAQKFSMSGGKNDAADVLELRKNAIAALIEKLEASAPTLKPDANCTSFKGPKK